MPSPLGRTTMPSPDAVARPVRAAMLTWCVTTTSAPGPRQRFSVASAAPVWPAVLDRSPKVELKPGSSRAMPGNASSAVSRVRHHCELSTAPTFTARLRKRSPMRRA